MISVRANLAKAEPQNRQPPAAMAQRVVALRDGTSVLIRPILCDRRSGFAIRSRCQAQACKRSTHSPEGDRQRHRGGGRRPRCGASVALGSVQDRHLHCSRAAGLRRRSASTAGWRHAFARVEPGPALLPPRRRPFHIEGLPALHTRGPLSVAWEWQYVEASVSPVSQLRTGLWLGGSGGPP